LDLPTHQQGGDAGNQGGGVAGARGILQSAASPCSQDVLARGQDTLVLIGSAPVAKAQRLSVPIHGTNRQHGIQGGRHVQTFAALITGRRHDQHSSSRTVIDHAGQEWVGRPRGGKLSTANVDNVAAGKDRLGQSAGQVQLRASPKRIVLAGLENRQQDAAAARGNAPHRAVRLTEKHAGDVSAVLAGGTLVGSGLDKSGQLLQIGAAQARVRMIDGTVKYADANTAISLRQGPEFFQPRQG
jgi:hypothetical protein